MTLFRSGLASLALSLSLVACAGGGEGAPAQAADVELPAAPGVRVEVASVQPTDASVSLQLPAEVYGRQDATLASPSGGFVDSVAVRAGDSVRKGQIIARIDYASRAAQLEIAQAQSEQAQAELERAGRLGDALSQQQLLSIETNARVAKANADLAGISASRALVKAPFSGRIAEVMVDPGEIAGPGTPVARLVQPDPALIKLSVSDRDIPHVAEGQALSLNVQSVSQTFQGVVVSRGVAADSATRTWTVEAEFPNPDEQLMSGMIGRVSMQRQVANQGIVIPQDWVVTRIDRSGVFIDQDGEAAWRDVTLGDFAQDQVVVESGLDVGDRVVTAGHRTLAEGDPLIIVRQGSCCSQGRVNW